MKLSVVDVESHLKFNRCSTFQTLLDEAYVQNCKSLEILNQYMHQFDHQ